VPSGPSGAVSCRPVRVRAAEVRPVPPKSAWFVCKSFRTKASKWPRFSLSSTDKKRGVRTRGRDDSRRCARFNAQVERTEAQQAERVGQIGKL
jgi:hypothetical protein